MILTGSDETPGWCDSYNREKSKAMFERVLEIASGKNDGYLVELGKRAKQILDEYF